MKAKFAILLTFLSFYCLECAAEIKILKNVHSIEEVYRGLGSIKLIKDEPVEMVDMTMCLRFLYKAIRQDQIVHAVGVSIIWWLASNPSWIAFGYPIRKNSHVAFLVDEKESGLVDIYDTNEWMNACLSFDSKTGQLHYALNGRLVNSFGGFSDVEFPSDFLNHTFIGRPYSQNAMSPEGQFADFNVWDRPMSVEEAEDWTSCRTMDKGNVVNWDTAQFLTENVTEYFLPNPEELCVPRRPGNVVFPMRRNFTSFVSTCHQFQGDPLVVQEPQTEPLLKEEAFNHANCREIPGSNNPATEAVWIGYWDALSEGNYTNVNTGNELGLGRDSYTNWDITGEPNGGTIENCASLQFRRSMWNDMPCDYELCFFCELETYPFFVMRGLCHKSKFDYQYSWKIAATDSEFYSFRGYKDTEMSFDTKRNKWVLQLYSNSSIFALSDSPEYPIGTHLWKVHGDPCYDDPITDVVINFNACKLDQYNCRDGTCIDIKKRCDRRVDCTDSSDELNCEIITTDKSYLKEVSPPPVDGRTKSAVDIGIDVLSILEINEVDFLMSLQVEVSLNWLDKRLTMIDLHNETSLNTLTDDFKRKIWLPQVVFYNTKDKEESLNDDKSHATISREGKYELSPMAELHNNHIYKGSENPLTIKRVYSKDFICEFNMRNYPFDTQECSAIFIMKGSLGKFIDLLPGHVNYLGPIDLTQYFVKNINISSFEVPPNINAVKVNIVFSRRIFATLLTTYVPTALLCIVCFSTNHFQPFFFEAIVTVNLTSLLVLTTLFISVSNSLPPTSYIKMVDIWLLFTLIIPFTEVILHTYIDNLRATSNRKINAHGKIRTVQGSKDNRKNKIENLDHEIPDKAFAGNIAKQFFGEETESGRLRVAHKLAVFGIPMGFTTFTVIYFIVGLVL